MTNEEFAAFIREAIDRTTEDCARIAESEEAPEGPAPLEVLNMPIEELVEAVVRATRMSIAANIRGMNLGTRH